jgi:hypothetical protein
MDKNEKIAMRTFLENMGVSKEIINILDKYFIFIRPEDKDIPTHYTFVLDNGKYRFLSYKLLNEKKDEYNKLHSLNVSIKSLSDDRQNFY